MSNETVKLHEMNPGQSGDTFALLIVKEQAKTRDDKPYFRCTFRDAKRSATAMIWSDHALFQECSSQWQPGAFFKLRCRYTENSFGSQIDIDRIRPVNEADREAGFREDDFFPVTRFDRAQMFDELLRLVREHIEDEPLQRLILNILTENSEDIQRHSAAVRNHHAFFGGFLEHVLSVTRTAIYVADKYRAYYSDMNPPLSKSLVVAGAVLHDIGKLEELAFKPSGWEYTARGRLVGHIFIGRDLMLQHAAQIPELDPETVLRLEHIIIAHQGLPEWGSPISPMTPEAMLVHFADDLDAKFHELAVQLETRWPQGAQFTSRTNPLHRYIFIGLNPDDSSAPPSS